MEELLPTSPNLSLHGSIDTIEEVSEVVESDPFVVESVDKAVRLNPSPSPFNIYHRQGIVLPVSVDIRDKLGADPEVNDESKWVPQTEIDIMTALADGRPILFRSIDSIGGDYTATLVGYDVDTQVFIARDDKEYFDVTFAVIIDPILSTDFWTVTA